MRPHHSWTNGPSTGTVYDEGKDDTFKQAACKASSSSSWRRGRRRRSKDPEHTKVAGHCKVFFSFCGLQYIRLQQERQRPAASHQTSPNRRQPLPPLLRVTHSRDPPTSCFHETTRLLSLSRPPTHAPISERPTLATVPREPPTAPGACRFRVPRLWHSGVLQQGALDARLRSSLGSV